MRNFLFSVCIDAIIFGCFYLWQVQHVEAAHHFLTFVLWTFAALLWVGVLFGKSSKRTKFTFNTLLAYITTAATVALMVFVGMTACAITYFLAWIFAQAKVTGEKEKQA